jgi:4-diphosphocytidyl-2-C-methyl-D-erythritol kinase
MSFTALAPAKLNLFLNITGRRDDGYHLLDSLFAFVELGDEIKGEPSAKPWLSAWGEFATGVGAEADNLAVRARDLMFAEAGVSPSLAITLEKRIPVAAGLGGGSADAAVVLRALNRYLDLNWPLERLLPLAAKLGADVPACLESQPVIARGIGDILSAAPAMPPCGVLLVNPNVPTPTPAVFKAFKDMNPRIAERHFMPIPQAFADVNALVRAIQPRGNDLLDAAISVTPVIRDVLEVLGMLPDVRYFGLSGSGATCFALFDTDYKASMAASEFWPRRPRKRNEIWWTWAGGWAEGFASV